MTPRRWAAAIFVLLCLLPAAGQAEDFCRNSFAMP